MQPGRQFARAMTEHEFNGFINSERRDGQTSTRVIMSEGFQLQIFDAVIDASAQPFYLVRLR